MGLISDAGLHRDEWTKADRAGKVKHENGEILRLVAIFPRQGMRISLGRGCAFPSAGDAHKTKKPAIVRGFDGEAGLHALRQNVSKPCTVNRPEFSPASKAPKT